MINDYPEDSLEAERARNIVLPKIGDDFFIEKEPEPDYRHASVSCS